MSDRSTAQIHQAHETASACANAIRSFFVALNFPFYSDNPAKLVEPLEELRKSVLSIDDVDEDAIQRLRALSPQSVRFRDTVAPSAHEVAMRHAQKLWEASFPVYDFHRRGSKTAPSEGAPSADSALDPAVTEEAHEMFREVFGGVDWIEAERLQSDIEREFARARTLAGSRQAPSRSRTRPAGTKIQRLTAGLITALKPQREGSVFSRQSLFDLARLHCEELAPYESLTDYPNFYKVISEVVDQGVLREGSSPRDLILRHPQLDRART